MNHTFEDFLPGTPGCPYSTADLPGVGGHQGPDPEDFVVEEIPAYAPTGAGDHWFVQVRKRGLSTPQLCRILARAAECNDRDIGVAGRKDAYAITTQWLSLPKQPVDPGDDRIELLEMERHGHKLRMGHSAGNRFTIRWVDVVPEAEERLPALMALTATGLPNYFGPQRFGRDARGVQQSLVQLGRGRARKRELRFAVSVIQSVLFNQWLGQRLRDGYLDQALVGDVLKKRETGGLFECEDADIDSPRVLAGEIDPTGPIFGPKMWAAKSDAGAREDEILESTPLSDAERERMGKWGPGSRRVARIVPGDVEWTLEEGTLIFRFTLPPGAYATTVLAAWANTGLTGTSELGST